VKEISLHILDVAENGITAGADCIRIEIVEKPGENRLYLTVADNGEGIAREQIDRAVDPFYTSRTTRRVGLGLSLLDAAARQCEGSMQIHSDRGAGTEVAAEFRYDHIDRAPLGDMASTMTTLIMGNPEVDFYYRHQVADAEFAMDTRQVRESFDGAEISDFRVLRHVMAALKDGEKRLQTGRTE